MDHFAERLLEWHDRCGRHDLPWQQEPGLYRVWISEVMLQQTRVTTVIPYFERFISRFPQVSDLAAAPLDEVLALWSGLGYYARARHLHRAAQEIISRHSGVPPTDLAAWCALPGVGRSTAGAILTLAAGAYHPILDGNVKRVLARYHTVPGWPGLPEVQQRLWVLAEAHTPQHRTGAYTQAIMDLGATLCTRTRPDCLRCPVAEGCKAHESNLVANFPMSRPRQVLPVREMTFVLLLNQEDNVFLERRPAAGIWGGLWTFPECPAQTDPIQWLA